MRRIHIPLLIAVLILLNIGCRQNTSTSSDFEDSIVCNGLRRTYLVHTPPFYSKTKSLPLVLALHGGGGTGKGMEQLTLGEFNTLADKEDFVVVYPDGIETHWNDGRVKVSYRAHKEKIDDVGFISVLIDHLVNELNIDKNRVYATGISNGAMMSFRLANELSDKIAAIAPVAGAMPETSTPYLSPSKPISVLIINGKKDSLVHWEGGKIGFGFGLWEFGKTLSVADTVKYWININKCSSIPVITNEPDKDPNDGTNVQKEVYGNTKDGTEVVLYTIEGGGHTWPGGYQYLSERIVGKTCRDIDANKVIWEFFKKHRRN